MNWTRSGPYLVHASGYRAPCHWHALVAGMMPAHVRRLGLDADEFEDLWAVLNITASERRAWEDRRTAKMLADGVTGHVARWAQPNARTVVGAIKGAA